jgi:hypothetical protein
LIGRAANLVRDLPHYRRDAIDAGLRACGFVVEHSTRPDPRPGDVLVIWNRYGHYERAADKYEAAGALVLVIENGWLGEDERRRQRYAVAAYQHNGAGAWLPEDRSRVRAMGVHLKDWRETGEHILVLPQRGIGPKGVAMPAHWIETVTQRLRQMTARPIRVRLHPGAARPPLEPDFENCWAAVTWGSGAAIKAIVAGIPVFYDMPNWIGAKGARRLAGADIERPYLGGRLDMLVDISWAQWEVDEIASGFPFKRLLAA